MVSIKMKSLQNYVNLMGNMMNTSNMTLKTKISLYISLMFTLLFGLVCLVIITLFSDFRKQEFEDRLNEKALTAIKLLVEVKEVDKNMLKIIDQNTINKLYNEKTLVFDSNQNLIYSSLDDTKIDWSTNDLNYLKSNKTFFKRGGENEIYGLFHDTNDKDYYAIISANDNYGKRKLNYLISILIGAALTFTIGAWGFTFYAIKRQFSPLDAFHRKIRNINDLNSDAKLEIDSKSKNEIALLSNEFNHMMGRITESYQNQREFTSQASHELRTPLARISALIENQLSKTQTNDLPFMMSISDNVRQLKELISSLLILSKIDSGKTYSTEKCRVDEAIYNCIDDLSRQFPDLKVSFFMDDKIENLEDMLEVNCNQNLLEIAIKNLIKNAYLYSNDQSIKIQILAKEGNLMVEFANKGLMMSSEEVNSIFKPFKRSANSTNKSGLGLGLRIAQRIFKTFNYDIVYDYLNDHHVFTVIFSR